MTASRSSPPRIPQHLPQANLDCLPMSADGDRRQPQLFRNLPLRLISQPARGTKSSNEMVYWAGGAVECSLRKPDDQELVAVGLLN
jgi:hypothetical protein